MEIYLVGGAVRDQLLGLQVNDKDWLVVNGSEREMLARGFIQVGKQFPVFLHPQTHEEYALARTEFKTSKGYQGFSFDTRNISLIEDLKRRDLTINAMAIDEHGRLHDPFNGQQDINHKKLRHVSLAFNEDPLRVLRVARFAAKFHYLNFSIAQETINLMRKITASGELESLSGERIYQEFIKAFNTKNPEIFINILQSIGSFWHILQPLNILSASDLKPLLHAKQQHCNINEILYAIIISKLDSECDVLEILTKLKVPRNTQHLCFNIYRYHYFFSQLKTHSEKEILAALKAINALRNKVAFELFTLTLGYIYHEDSHALSSVALAKSIQQKLTAHDYTLLIQDIHHKKIISKKIEQQQFLIISDSLAKNIH